MARNADFGGILGETVALLSDNARDVGLYTLVVGGLTAVGVLTGLTQTSSMAFSAALRADANGTTLSGLASLLLGIVSIAAGYLLAKRLLASRGSLRSDANRFWLYLGLYILWIIGLVAGVILLVVPGIILLVRWSAAAGFLIGDERGIIDSFRASWRATKGHGWSIFFACLMFLVIAFAVGFPLGGILGALMEVGVISEAVVGVVSAFLEAFSNALGLAFTIAVYVLVNENANDLSEVFS